MRMRRRRRSGLHTNSNNATLKGGEKSNFKGRSAPGIANCPGQVASSKKVGILEDKFCPRQRSCPGQVACSTKQSDS